MLSGVGIVCFASSYAVAWVLELSRLLFRSGIRGAVMIGFAAAGLVMHSAFLCNRAATAAGAPLSSERDWFLVAAWATVVVYLHLSLSHPKIPFGLFLLPLSLGLIGVGVFLAPDVPLAREPASRVWGAVHGASIVLAAVSVCIGFVTGAMYLGQSRRLKDKRTPFGRLRLPSLEWLQQTSSRAIVVSWLLLGAGVLSGMILNRIRVADAAARLYWSDPVVLSTWLMFLWLLAAVATIGLYRPARQGRKVAYITIASFVFLAIMLAVGLLMNSEHWRRQGRGERGEGRERIAQCQPHSVMLPDGLSAPGSSPCFRDTLLSPGGRPC